MHGGHRREPDPLRLELRDAARERPVDGGAGQDAAGPGDGGGDDPSARGADADGIGDAGHTHHRALGKDAAHPRARRQHRGAAGLQRDRHRQQSRQGRQ